MDFLIIRLSSLGDIIHTLPAFSALRKKFPESRISWIVEQKGQDILELVPGIDQIHVLPVTKWQLSRKHFWQILSRFKKKISGKDQVALDFQGLVKSAFISYLSHAKRRIGFHRQNLREPLASFFYTDHLEEIPETNHVVQKNLALLHLLGIQEDGFDFPLHIPDELCDSVLSKLKQTGYTNDKKLVLLNVGAAWETKRWFPDRWIRTARMIQKADSFLLLLWGNEKEKSLASYISRNVHIPISPFLNLKEVIALIKRAHLLISGDTFALQAACALSIPVVGIFGPTSPQRNGPFLPADRVAFHPIKCSYCYKRKCSKLECLDKISSEEVTDLVFKRLKSS